MRFHGLLSLFSLTALVAAPSAQASFVECTDTIHVLTGENVGDSFGFVSAPIPDVTGDGAPELLVGAPFHSNLRVRAGRAYLYDGASGALLFRWTGPDAEDRLGHSVRDADDVDGDGVCDLIVGGRGAPAVPGIVLVLSGLDGGVIHELRSGVAGDSFGYAVTGLGDVDGDLVPDLAVGAILDGTAGANAGKALVISGADGTTVLHTFLGLGAGHNFGTAVARLTDLTGDGVDELLVGAANAGGPQGRGRAYVYDVVTETQLYNVGPDSSGSEFGQYFVSDAGLVDADAVHDFYVGDFADGGGRGKAYLFSGATGARIRVYTGSAGDGFGIGRSIGDLDGDGRDDLLLGSWQSNDGAPNAGKAEIFSGADGALLRRLTSLTAGEAMGFDAHGIGDVNGDGEPEMVLTAANYASSRGIVYVVGRAPVLPFGLGLAGTGGLEPRLELSGCPRPGSGMVLGVTQGRGQAIGSVVIGTQRIDQPFRGGVLYPDLGFLRFPHRLAGIPGGAGEGQTTILLPVPDDAALVGQVFHAQGAWLDPAALQGVSMTSGLRLTIY